MFEKLAELVAVALWWLDGMAERLDDEHALLALLRLCAPGRAPRDQHVVALAVREGTEGGLDGPGAVVDEQQLVAHRVAVEVVHRLGWDDGGDGAVGVVHQRLAPTDRIAASGQSPRLEVMMAVRLLLPLFLTCRA